MGITGHGDESIRASPLRPFLPYFPFPDPLFCPTDPTLQIYPSEIPEEQLKLLGPLSRQYMAEEISRWPVTSSNTLSALLDPSDGKWEASQVNPRQQRGTGAGEPKLGPLRAQAKLGVKVLPEGGTVVLQYMRFYREHLSSLPACNCVNSVSQVQQLLSRYLALGGTLTGPLLQKIGGRNLCNLQEKQINQIPPAAIRYTTF